MKNSNVGVVSSSEASTDKLKSYGIEVFDLNEVSELSVYVDGADEINSYNHMIKGGGAALLVKRLFQQSQINLSVLLMTLKMSIF